MKKAILFGGLIALLTLSTLGADGKPLCRVVSEWVATKVEAGTLPSTFEELNRLPMAYRRAVFGSLPPDQKRDLMLAQIKAFQATTHVTAEQSAALRRLLRFTNTAYHRRVEDATQDSIVKEINRLFPKEPAFFEIGEPEPRRLGGFVGAKVGGYTPVALPPTCDCSRSSSYCPSGQTCENLGCDIPWAPCGFLLLYECNGVCYAGCGNPPCPAGPNGRRGLAWTP